VKPAIVHPGARTELEKAVAWYNEKRAGLGYELEDEVQRAIKRIRSNPAIGAVYGSGKYRFVRVRRFPYVIYYHEEIDWIWVPAIAHERRRPGYWRRRRPS